MGLGLAVGQGRRGRRMRDRARLVFFLLSLANMVLLGLALARAARPGWAAYQRSYHRLEAQSEPNAAAKAAVESAPVAIAQIILPGLQRVDRCTTCHQGVENPAMKGAPEPFSYHPDISRHPPSRFGCTICHGGQGLATNLAAAHGRVAHWHQPLLPREFVRASCGQCHTKGDVPGVPELAEGRRLFDTHGCRGCHRLRGVGGTIGPDLSREGATRRDPAWLERHFLDPRAVSPNSVMPNFHFTPGQAKDLTYYMLSLTGEEMSNAYTSESVIPSIPYGRELFARKNCITCHSIGGVGGKSGPDLEGVTRRHSARWLDEHFVNPTLVSPGSTMPAYDLTSDERTALIRFMAVATDKDAEALLAGGAKALTPEEEAVEAGARAFVHYGCVGCHGQGAAGGVANPNSQGGQVPSLVHVADDYKKSEVMAIIRDGKTPPLADPAMPAPPLTMPSWKGTVNEEDLHNIVEYLWSLKPKGEGSRW